MKIQILGNPRTGTTTLYYALLNTINHSAGIYEPLNPHTNYKIINDKKLQEHLSIINNCNMNVIEKNTIVNEPKNCTTEHKRVQEVERQFNFYKSYLQNFDKVILLYRKNIISTCRSLANAQVYGTWHTSYTSDPTLNFEKHIPVIELNNKVLLKLSKHLNIPLTYYEDLYSGDLDYLNNFLTYYDIKVNNLKEFYSVMDPQHKLSNPTPLLK